MLESHGYVKNSAWLKAFKHHCHGITNEIGLLFFFFFPVYLSAWKNKLGLPEPREDLEEMNK